MPETFSTASPREIFKRVVRVIEDSEIDTYADLFAVDGTLELPFAPPGVSRRIEGQRRSERSLRPRPKGCGRRRRSFSSARSWFTRPSTQR
jgi:hypothetical protein